MKKLLIILAIATLSALKVSGQNIVPIKDALKHAGKNVTICDKVYGVKKGDKPNTVVLYFGGDYPNQLLTVVAIGDDQTKSKNPAEADYKGKDVCVTGMVVNKKGKAQITVTEPKQVRYLLIDGPVKQKFN